MSSSYGELGCLCSCLRSDLGSFSAIVSSAALCPHPLSQTPTVLLVSLSVSCRPLWHCSLLSNLFSFCSSDSLNSIKVTDSSAYLNLPLNPFSEFFISISELFSSRFFLLSRFSVSYWYFYFVHISFSDFSTSSFSSVLIEYI